MDFLHFPSVLSFLSLLDITPAQNELPVPKIDEDKKFAFMIYYSFKVFRGKHVLACFFLKQ